MLFLLVIFVFVQSKSHKTQKKPIRCKNGVENKIKNRSSQIELNFGYEGLQFVSGCKKSLLHEIIASATIIILVEFCYVA